MKKKLSKTFEKFIEVGVKALIIKNDGLPCRFKWGLCRYNSMLYCIADTYEDCKLYQEYNPKV